MASFSCLFRVFSTLFVGFYPLTRPFSTLAGCSDPRMRHPSWPSRALNRRRRFFPHFGGRPGCEPVNSYVPAVSLPEPPLTSRHDAPQPLPTHERRWPRCFPRTQPCLHTLPAVSGGVSRDLPDRYVNPNSWHLAVVQPTNPHFVLANARSTRTKMWACGGIMPLRDFPGAVPCQLWPPDGRPRPSSMPHMMASRGADCHRARWITPPAADAVQGSLCPLPLRRGGPGPCVRGLSPAPLVPNGGYVIFARGLWPQRALTGLVPPAHVGCSDGMQSIGDGMDFPSIPDGLAGPWPCRVHCETLWPTDRL